MSSKELVGEGPIFLTIKAVRGKPLMKELKENMKKMCEENVIGLAFNWYKWKWYNQYNLGLVLKS